MYLRRILTVVPTRGQRETSFFSAVDPKNIEKAGFLRDIRDRQIRRKD